MNTVLKGIAAAAALVATAGAQADVIFIDNFDAPTTQLVITDDTLSDGGVMQSAPGTMLSAPNIAQSRRIGAELISDIVGGGEMETKVGGTFGRLQAQASTGASGKAMVLWTIPAFSLTEIVGNSYFFSVIASTQGVNGSNVGVPTEVNFSFIGANSFSLDGSIGQIGASASGTPTTFALSSMQSQWLSQGGDLMLTFTGRDGFSMTVDQFAISVPEPSSLALAGLALLGAGFAASRRKTK